MKPSHPHLPVLRSPEDGRPLGRRCLHELRVRQHFRTLATNLSGEILDKGNGTHVLAWVGDVERRLSPLIYVEAL